ncbi:hypothetical protein [Bradyrhizobium liaoningense]|uniref:hypothetical protein n=1 Tax=Bradyrhizobium liaoningense TaxID=43992 RepID=UPI001BA661E3|nr:hypothetical protein [Bradyrhizobium liaoningense]MBR1167483.1 hypothetical protein [Bradyrhizobium liaoningense]
MSRRILARNTKLDAAALNAVGRPAVDLDDPISVRQYLEAALERGDLNAAIIMMVLALRPQELCRLGARVGDRRRAANACRPFRKFAA